MIKVIQIFMVNSQQYKILLNTLLKVLLLMKLLVISLITFLMLGVGMVFGLLIMMHI